MARPGDPRSGEIGWPLNARKRVVPDRGTYPADVSDFPS
jgi:hypothetical protein